MKKSFYIFIFVLLIVASTLRLYKLGQVPASPNWDEVALGYNAYSLLLTGKDEYGKQLPIILRSYDDYKPALYTYLVIPAIKIFDLNVFAVRLPAAVFGIITVIATYFLLRELFGKIKLDMRIGRWLMGIPEVGSFLLAISPWHLQFSRIAFESNVGLSLNVLSLLFFLKALRQPKFLILTSFIFAINLYMYQSERVFVPLFCVMLIAVFRRELLALPKKYLAISVIIGFLVATPMVFTTITDKQALARARGVSVFADKTQLLKESSIKFAKSKQQGDILGMIFNNRRVVYAKTIAVGYLSHYDLNWLFVTGDLPRHHAPYMGLLYLWELPFLLIGLYQLVFGNFNKKIKSLIILWFLAAPIPASVTSGVPHAVRSLNFLPTFQIFTAIGLICSLLYLQNVRHKILDAQIRHLVIGFFILFLIFNFFYYLSQYFVQQNYFTSDEWQYGYRQAVDEVKEIRGSYDKIIVSNKPYLDQSYMFFLFYLKYPPEIYQQEARNPSGGFRENHSYSNFEFRSIDWEKEEKSNGILYVGRPEDFPQEAKILKIINFLNGRPAIQIVEG